jgi:tetratricopeptide (TPR) repeat protein
MEEEIDIDPLLERAKTVVSDGDFQYAEFLYREILKKYPGNVDIRCELHRLRKLVHFKARTLAALTKQMFVSLRIWYLRKKHVPTWRILEEIERFFDGDPSSIVGYRHMSEVAFGAELYGVAEFAIQAIPQERRSRSDLLRLADTFFEEKKFDDAVRVANSMLESDPDDEEAKDMMWRASVDKSINKNVNLVMVDGCNSFVPPKVDASQIVMSNQKREDEDEKRDADKFFR